MARAREGPSRGRGNVAAVISSPAPRLTPTVAVFVELGLVAPALFFALWAAPLPGPLEAAPSSPQPD